MLALKLYGYIFFKTHLCNKRPLLPLSLCLRNGSSLILTPLFSWNNISPVLCFSWKILLKDINCSRVPPPLFDGRDNIFCIFLVYRTGKLFYIRQADNFFHPAFLKGCLPRTMRKWRQSWVLFGLFLVKRRPLRASRPGPFSFLKSRNDQPFCFGGQTMGLKRLVAARLEVLLIDSLCTWLLPLTWEKMENKNSLVKIIIPPSHVKADIYKNLICHWITAFHGPFMKPPHIHVQVVSWELPRAA